MPPGKIRLVKLALLALASAAPLLAQAPAFRSGVELVTVPVNVTALDGSSRIDGLTLDEFRLFEDGVLQTLSYARREHPSLSVCVVLDTSGSMRQFGRFAIAMSAYREIIANIDPNDEVSVISSGMHSRILLPWSAPLRAAGSPLDIKIENLTSLNSAISDSVVMALDQIKTATRRDRAIVVVSDGLENASHVSISSAIRTRQQSETAIYAFHTAPSRPEGVEVQALPALVGDSGGIVIPVGRREEVNAAVKRVMDDLRDHYVLAYAPLKALDGKYRRIKVESTRDGVQVRHRGGYLALPNSAGK